MRKEQVVLELQMLTGIISNDIQYLYNQLLESAKEHKEKEPEKVEYINNIVKEDCESNLDDWFSNL